MTAGELKQRREQLGLSRPQFAKKLDVSPKTIEHWEYDKGAIPKWVSLALAALEFVHQTNQLL